MSPCFSLFFSISSIWWVSQRTTLQFEVSSATTRFATLPWRSFFVNSLTGPSWIIFPITFTFFMPWTSSEIFILSLSKFIPSSAATIWAAPSLLTRWESFALFASTFLSSSSFFKPEEWEILSMSCS